MLLGAHVPGDSPLQEAEKVGADCIQMFVGPPQSWKKPPPRDDAEELRSSSIPIFVHAPYLINVASPNNRIRIPSRKILSNTLERAGEIGAAGVIVHAGHAEDGVENAMARRVDALAQLWEHLADFDVQFCFDTCHAHAAGEELSDVVPRVLDAVGKIDLLHCNDSRDKAGTGADRHANLADGNIDDDLLVEMVVQAKAPAVICETPWPALADDIAYLRSHL